MPAPSLVYRTMKDGATPQATFQAAFVDDGSGRLHPAMVLWDLVAGAAVTFASASAVYEGVKESKIVAASQTSQVLGATGAIGDRLDMLKVTPTSLTVGAITIQDGGLSAETVFAGGTLLSLIPFYITKNKLSTNGPWKVTTGAGAIVEAYGDFT